MHFRQKIQSTKKRIVIELIIILMFFCTPMKIFSNSLKKIYNYYKPIVGFVRSNEGTGTGFLINNDGIFVTAKHVAGNLIDTRIYLNDKEQEIEGIYYTNVPNIDLIFYKLKKVQYKKNKSYDLRDLNVFKSEIKY
jgi:hypothetical protein